MTLDALTGHIPDAVIQQIPDVEEKFEINTALRLAHFLSQCGHESAGFTAVRENLNYSADALQKIFKKYFPDAATANEYARQPEKIANKIYANRMGNGDESSGDGFLFRGRGFIQVTGRTNYTEFNSFAGDNVIENPDLVASAYPLLSASWFFSKNGLNAIADQGSDMDTITAVTKRVNGGTLGLDDRAKRFNEYFPLLSDASV